MILMIILIGQSEDRQTSPTFPTACCKLRIRHSMHCSGYNNTKITECRMKSTEIKTPDIMKIIIGSKIKVNRIQNNNKSCNKNRNNEH